MRELFTDAKEVMFYRCWFVCLQEETKTMGSVFIKQCIGKTLRPTTAANLYDLLEETVTLWGRCF